MKIHAEEIFKRNIQFILFIAVALMCSVTSLFSFRAIARSGKPIIIGIDSNGTRIVTEPTDPIYRTEALAFVQKFFFNSYNFNTSNFYKRIGFATSLMSEELWKRKESEILDLKSKIERDGTEISSEVLKVTKDDTGTYHGLIILKEKSRLNVREHKVLVSLKLKSVGRTFENPFGMEVDTYEETISRD